MELIFGTKTSKGKISKNARISSSDSVRAAITIDFSANIVTDPDTLSAVRFTPSQMIFSKDTTKFTITVANFDTNQANLSKVGSLTDGVEAKIKTAAIKPEKSAKIEFLWTGKAPEYDNNYVATFNTGLRNVTRISVPYTVRGTKGQKPGTVPQHAATPATINKPPANLGKPGNPPPTGQAPAVSTPQGAPVAGQAVSGPGAEKQAKISSGRQDLLKQVNPDSVKAEKPLPGQPWPPR